MLKTVSPKMVLKVLKVFFKKKTKKKNLSLNIFCNYACINLFQNAGRAAPSPSDFSMDDGDCPRRLVNSRQGNAVVKMSADAGSPSTSGM